MSAEDDKVVAGSENGRPTGGHAPMSIDAALMTFRTTWLRAVALAWVDSGFAGQLQTDPIAAMKQQFQFHWPWPGAIAFEVKVGQGLQWAGDDWVWPPEKEDSLTLYLPISKQPTQERERASALADYYAQRPSIFGAMGGGGGGTSRANSLFAAGFSVTRGLNVPFSSVVPRSAPVDFGGNAPPPNGFTPNSGSFTDFEVVLLSALAKAWNNQTFAELIQSDKNLATALQTIRGYTVPWRLILRVLDDPHAAWDAREMTWTGLTPHLLTLNLPDRPPAIYEHSIALATYNGTGAEYPFTCCA